MIYLIAGKINLTTMLAAPAPIPAPGDLAAWWLFCGILVFLMQMGFMLYEAGCVRKINQQGIATKNLMMMLASILGFIFIGCGLMYGKSVGGYIGNLSHLVINNRGDSWLFCQLGYAVITSTIISGAIAGRSRLRANVIAAFVMTAFVYPIHGHWVWGGGWLEGVQDFAGSGTVHYVGGIAAAMGAWVLGPRIHRSYKKKDAAGLWRLSIRNPIGPRDLSLASYGMVLLMIGWMGFNGGSIEDVDAISNPNKANLLGTYFLETACAGVGGMLSVFIFYFIRYCLPFDQEVNRPVSFLINPFDVLTGVLAGMVTTTGVCDILNGAGEALVVGACGGFFAFFCTRMVVDLGIDDPVDAISVHAGGGLAGLVFGALIPLYRGTATWTMAYYQCMDILVGGIFTALSMLLLFSCLKRGWLGNDWFRCSEPEELAGIKYPDGSVRNVNDDATIPLPNGKVGPREALPKKLRIYITPKRVLKPILYLLSTSVIIYLAKLFKVIVYLQKAIGLGEST